MCDNYLLCSICKISMISITSLWFICIARYLYYASITDNSALDADGERENDKIGDSSSEGKETINMSPVDELELASSNMPKFSYMFVLCVISYLAVIMIGLLVVDIAGDKGENSSISSTCLALICIMAPTLVSYISRKVHTNKLNTKISDSILNIEMIVI